MATVPHSDDIDGTLELDIDPDQWWFWTARWQEMEREAAADIEAGRFHRYENGEELLRALRARHAADADV